MAERCAEASARGGNAQTERPRNCPDRAFRKPDNLLGRDLQGLPNGKKLCNSQATYNRLCVLYFTDISKQPSGAPVAYV